MEEIYEDRARAIFPHLERLFEDRWPTLRCLDTASHEGWFSLQLAPSISSYASASFTPLKTRWGRCVSPVR